MECSFADLSSSLELGSLLLAVPLTD